MALSYTHPFSSISQDHRRLKNYDKIASTQEGLLGDDIRNLFKPKNIPNYRTLLRWCLTTGEAFLSHTLRNVWFVSCLVVVIAMAVLRFTPPFSWLPEPREARDLLGTLLTGQAAIAALTLAVTIFVMQGASARSDTDDRVYHEYIQRSRVRRVFVGSLFAVFITGVVFLLESVGGANEGVAADIPRLRNLVLMAPFAFIANLLLPAYLFENAIALSRPQHWWTIKLDVNKRDVRDAVGMFLRHHRRASPGGAEGSADEAIRALLDEARLAMAERRQREFSMSLGTIKELLGYAMEEISREGISWEVPGTQPNWPPLKELGSNLYSFRKEILRQADRDYVVQLVNLDYWLLDNGIRRDCGEMFTVALNGFQWNYEITTGMDDSLLRLTYPDQLWGLARAMFFDASPNKAYPYVVQLMRHQVRLLHDALHADRPTDYERLHREFEAMLRHISRDWEIAQPSIRETEGLYELLIQEYRIALLGLGGHAVYLSESGNIADPNRYIDAVRGQYALPQQLADDIPQMLARGDNWNGNQWLGWEMEDTLSGEVQSVNPDKFPLTSFSVRLVELTTEPILTLNLHTRAKQVLDWFETNSARLESYVRTTPPLSFEEQLDLATEALRAAVHTDEVAEDFEIIGWELSVDRTSAFESKVLEVALSESTVSKLFEQADAVAMLPADADGGPEVRHIHNFVSKGFFSRVPEHASTHYATIEGTDWGRGISNDILSQFTLSLAEAIKMTAELNSLESLLLAIEQAARDLNAAGKVLVLLQGDWRDILVDLMVKEPEGFSAPRQIPASEHVGEMGRYKGNPIVLDLSRDERHLYVVDLAAWGSLVRAEVEPQKDIVVSIQPVSAERAREILDANPNHFATEPDEPSKLRKLQTLVEIDVRVRAGFKVEDPSQARRIDSAS